MSIYDKPGTWFCGGCGQWVRSDTIHYCVQPAGVGYVVSGITESEVIALRKAIEQLIEKVEQLTQMVDRLAALEAE